MLRGALAETRDASDTVEGKAECSAAAASLPAAMYSERSLAAAISSDWLAISGIGRPLEPGS